MREARAQYFPRAGFDERTYTERWVVLRTAGLPLLAFPNTRARVRAVRLHDLHHVLTGYDTSWAGEGEIGAWELGSGCADHWAAWYLNGCAAAIALCFAPRRVLAGFRRGRRERNLYREEFDDALLDETVAGMRARLGIAPA
jgi:ubiquinone biosynthesis protein Coq4